MKREKKCMNEPFESIGRTILTVTCNFRYSCYKCCFICCCHCVSFWCCCLFDSETIAKYSMAIIMATRKEKEKKTDATFLLLLLAYSDSAIADTPGAFILFDLVYDFYLFFKHIYYMHLTCRDGNIIVAMEKLSLYYLRPLSVHMHAYMHIAIHRYESRNGALG